MKLKELELEKNYITENESMYNINDLTKDGYTKEFVNYINTAAKGKKSNPMTAEESFKILGI